MTVVPISPVGPVTLLREPLNINDVHKILLDEGVQVKHVSDELELDNRNVVIYPQDDMLVVEGNVCKEFQTVQKLLSKKFIHV